MRVVHRPLLGRLPCPEPGRDNSPATWPVLEESLWPFALQQMSLPARRRYGASSNVCESACATRNGDRMILENTRRRGASTRFFGGRLVVVCSVSWMYLLAGTPGRNHRRKNRCRKNIILVDSVHWNTHFARRGRTARNRRLAASARASDALRPTPPMGHALDVAPQNRILGGLASRLVAGSRC